MAANGYDQNIVVLYCLWYVFSERAELADSGHEPGKVGGTYFCRENAN